MNTRRFVASAVAVWILRVALNWTFYTKVIGARAEQISAAHPGIFRQVVPAYILTDLLFALAFTYLFVRVGTAFGGGALAGMKLGLLVAILSPVIGSLYQYFSVTFMPIGLAAAESVFQVIAHAIEGGVAGAIYKTQPAPYAQAAGAR
jgi:uncharacterized membrane protein